MSAFIVGLTGGIGSGKSAVSARFERRGVEVVDADIIAREVVAPGTPALEAISEHFGKAVLHADATLNRSALRQRVFANDADKAWLNALLHPVIRQAMLDQCRQARSDYVILSVPLLIENGLDSLVDRVLVVDLPERVQRLRASARDDCTEDHIARIMATQVQRQQRLSKADDVIDNSGELDALDDQIDKLHDLYTQMAKTRGKT